MVEDDVKEGEVLAGDVLVRKITSQHPEDDGNDENEDVDDGGEDDEDGDGDDDGDIDDNV